MLLGAPVLSDAAGVVGVTGGAPVLRVLFLLSAAEKQNINIMIFSTLILHHAFFL